MSRGDGWDDFTGALSTPTTPRTKSRNATVTYADPPSRDQAIWVVRQYNPATDKHIVVALYDNMEAACKHMTADSRCHHQAYIVQSFFKGVGDS